MSLPASVGTCRVDLRLIQARVDGSDPDRDPDGIALPGSLVTFTASVPLVRVANATPPTLISMAPIQCNVNADGRLVSPDGELGVLLVASDDPDLDPHGWTYTVRITHPSMQPVTTTFVAPTGGDLDLATLVPVPPSPGEAVLQWQQVVDQAVIEKDLAEIARLAAEAAADDAAATAASISPTVPATPDTVPQRTAAGTVKVATPVDADDAVPLGARAVFTAETKAPGAALTGADVTTAATWDESADFSTRLPLTGVPAGAELRLVSEGDAPGYARASATNLFPYGSGRAGFSGGLWTARTSTISVDVGGGVEGTDAIVATSTGASSGGGFGTQNSTTVPALTLAAMGLRAGDVISGRYHLTVPAGATGRAQVRFYRGSTLVSETAQTPTTGDGYRTFSGLTVPVGADRLVLVTYTTSSAAGQVSRLSAIRFDYGTTPPASYIDGAQASGEWWGTADASPSSLGRVLGDGVIPAQGEAVARHLGAGRWIVSALGTAPDVMLAGEALTVDRDNAQQGITAPTCAWITSTTAALTANRAYLVRVAPSRDTTIASIAFRVTTASGTDDPCDVGIYDATGARLVSSGATTGRLNSTGTKTVNVGPLVLVGGEVYYAAISTNSTASLQRATVFADAYGTTMPAVESCYVSTAHPLPSSVSGVLTSDAAPVLVLREFA